MVSDGTLRQWLPVCGDFSSMAVAIIRTIESNRVLRSSMSLLVVRVTAACEARDSARRWSEVENGITRPLASSTALISCRTPISSFSWSLKGIVRNDRER